MKHMLCTEKGVKVIVKENHEDIEETDTLGNWADEEEYCWLLGPCRPSITIEEDPYYYYIDE